jgi:hypothetical protein
MNETRISLATASNTNHIQRERVKHGALTSGTPIVLENIPISKNAFSGFNFSQEALSKKAVHHQL